MVHWGEGEGVAQWLTSLGSKQDVAGLNPIAAESDGL